MNERVILETSFVVDLEREIIARLHGQASRFLERHVGTRFYLTCTTAGELGAGAAADDREAWERFLSPFHVLAPDEQAAWHFGRIFRHLKDNGQLIGSNNLWIAATALAHDMPVATRHVEHYRRVPGLEVLDYAT